MRHGKRFNHLGRKAGHRKALLRNLAISLIEHKRIKTTLAKAKALRQFIEPLVTKAKNDSMHNRRVVFSYLQNKEAIKELFGPLAAKVGERAGGYVRVIKLGFRRSDGAEMALIEFVDFNETYSTASGDEGKKKRRRRRKSGGGGAAETATATETAVEEATETVDEVAAAAEEAVDEAIDDIKEKDA